MNDVENVIPMKDYKEEDPTQLNDTVKETENVEHKVQSYTEIFDAVNSMSKLSNTVNATEKYANSLKNMSYDTMNQMGINIKSKEAMDKMNKFLEVIEKTGLTEEKINGMTEDEMDTLLGTEMAAALNGYYAKVSKEPTVKAAQPAEQEDLTQIGIKRDFLIMLVANASASRELSKLRAKIAEAQKEFNERTEDILGQVNSIDRLDAIEEELAKLDEKEQNDVTKVQKEQLLTEKTAIVQMLNLSSFTTKIYTKGKSQIKKEYKKNIGKLIIKVVKILKNDPEHSFFSPVTAYNKKLVPSLQLGLYKLFPEYKEEANLLVYTIFRKIERNTRQSVVDNELAMFYNIFMMNVNKMLMKEFNKDLENNDNYKSILKTLQEIKKIEE